MQKRLLTIFFCVVVSVSAAQNPQEIAELNRKIDNAKNDADKIEGLCQLADYYSIYKLESIADSVLETALSIAESSNDKELVLKTLFSNNVNDVNLWNSKTSYEKFINFINKGLEYAQQLNRDDYVALAYVRLAGINRKRQHYDEALEQVTHAFTTLGNTEADSIQCVLYNELGDIYMAKGDAVPAYKNYNNAFFIAYKIKNVPLQSEVYHHFFELYWLLHQNDIAKNNLLLSLELNKENNYKEGLMKDYIDLSRITDDTVYINKAEALAEELNSLKYKLDTRRRMFYWYMVNGRNSSITFAYLHDHPGVYQSLNNQGAAVLFLQEGWIYQYSGNPDSALVYFKMAEAELTKNYEDKIVKGVYTALADCYSKINEPTEAKKYYEKAFALSKQQNDFKSLSVICDSLSGLYKKESDYKLAYYYDQIADSCNRVMDEYAAKDKVMLLQVDRETKKHESDLLEIEHNKNRKDSLQIMAITIALAVFFAIMLFIGMFEVSKTTIRMLGYFAFISLFEFIVMLLDPFIVGVTNDEPLKKWGIKIFLIALLVPFQHFLEHNLITFLQSRKLLEVRQKISIKKWRLRSKKNIKSIPELKTEDNSDIEKDTAVL